MRTEAKLAAFLTLIIVVGAGLYWMYGSEDLQPSTPVDGALGDSLLTSNDARPVPMPPSPPPANPYGIAAEATQKSADRADRAAERKRARRDESAQPDVRVAASNEPVLPVSTEAPPAGPDTPATRPPSTEHVTRPPSTQRLTRLDAPSRPMASAGRAPSPGVPARGGQTALDRHVSRSGDTLASIALDYYFGARRDPDRYVRNLRDANPSISDAGVLPVGTVVVIPPDPAEVTSEQPRSRPLPPRQTVARRAPAVQRSRAASRTYRVQTGDTFYGISRKVLGASSRWRELFELNRELVRGEPKNLQPGQELILPGA